MSEVRESPARVRGLVRGVLDAWFWLSVSWLVLAPFWLIVHSAFWLSDVLVWSI